MSKDPAKRERQLANLRRGGVPPAPQGNQRRVTHGAYAAIAADQLSAKVHEVFVALAEDATLHDVNGRLPPADAPLVHLAAEVLCRHENVRSWLESHGWLDENDQPRQAILELEGRLRREAADYLDALGGSPRSRAKLGLDLARAQSVDLAKAMAAASAEDDVVDSSASEVTR